MLSKRDKMFSDGEQSNKLFGEEVELEFKFEYNDGLRTLKRDESEEQLSDEQIEKIEFVETLADGLIDDIKNNTVELDYGMNRETYTGKGGRHWNIGPEHHTLEWEVKA